jgi:hypothetical protein
VANNILALLTIGTSFHVPLPTHMTSYGPQSQSVWVRVSQYQGTEVRAARPLVIAGAVNSCYPSPFGICFEGADEPAHAFAHRTQAYFQVLALPLSGSEISRRCIRAPSVCRTLCDPAVSTLRRGSIQLFPAASLSVLTTMLSRQSVC